MSLRTTGKATLFALGLALSASTVYADGHEAAKDAEEEVEHAEGHHGGPITLHEVLFGHESLQFWGAVVNFILLAFLIRKLAKAPLTSFLTGRRSAIEKGIEEASEVKRAAEAVFTTYTERMKSLDSELAKLRKDVAEAAERDRVRIVEEANQTVARLKAETEQLIQRQTEQLETDIRREVVVAAAAAAEKAVRELSTPEDQQRLADAFMRELTKVAEQRAENNA